MVDISSQWDGLDEWAPACTSSTSTPKPGAAMVPVRRGRPGGSIAAQPIVMEPPPVPALLPVTSPVRSLSTSRKNEPRAGWSLGDARSSLARAMKGTGEIKRAVRDVTLAILKVAEDSGYFAEAMKALVALEQGLRLPLMATTRKEIALLVDRALERAAELSSSTAMNAWRRRDLSERLRASASWPDDVSSNALRKELIKAADQAIFEVLSAQVSGSPLASRFAQWRQRNHLSLDTVAQRREEEARQGSADADQIEVEE